MSGTVLVLAAGLGRRYGGLKQLVRFGPKKCTLMEYSLISAREYGYGRAVCVIRRENQAAVGEILGELRRHMPVICAYQELDDVPAGIALPAGRIKPWGSAHAVHAARHHIHGPFTVLNADDYYAADAWEAMAAIGAHPAALVAYQLGRTLSPHGPVSRGICQFRGDRLVSIEECAGIVRREDGPVSTAVGRPLGEETPVSMNFWHFPGEFLSFLGRDREYFFRGGDLSTGEWTLPGAVNRWIGEGAPIRGIICRAPWCGVTHPADGDWVEAVLREQFCRLNPLTGGPAGL